MNFYKVENKHIIEPLFKNMHHTLLQTYWQEKIGIAYTDNLFRPSSALINIGCFFFFAGIPNLDILRFKPNQYSEEYAILIATNEKWHALIENIYQGSCEKITRYSFSENTRFDIEKLQSMISTLPQDYQLQRIDNKCYRNIVRSKWAKDLCSNFASYSEFEKSGLGFVILKNNVIVSGASSYLVYDNGIEIEVDTREDERRNGLALICCAKLILSCLENHIYPNWDAHNQQSLKLATKLGYKFDRAYQAYVVWNF